MSYGSIFGDFGSFLESNATFQQLLNLSEEDLVALTENLSEEELLAMENAMTESGDEISIEMRFVTVLMSIMSIAASVPALMIILKLRSEEKKGLNEHILSKKVSRNKLLRGHIILAIFTGIIMVFAMVFGLWSASAPVMEEPFEFMEILKSGVVYIPAILFMIGIGTLLVAFLPRLTAIVWGYLGFSFFAVYLGKLMNLPEWMPKATPFGHIPQIPVDKMNWDNLIILSILSITAIIVGFIQYRNRDMTF